MVNIYITTKIDNYVLGWTLKIDITRLKSLRLNIYTWFEFQHESLLLSNILFGENSAAPFNTDDTLHFCLPGPVRRTQLIVISRLILIYQLLYLNENQFSHSFTAWAFLWTILKLEYELHKYYIWYYRFINSLATENQRQLEKRVKIIIMI